MQPVEAFKQGIQKFEGNSVLRALVVLALGSNLLCNLFANCDEWVVIGCWLKFCKNTP